MRRSRLGLPSIGTTYSFSRNRNTADFRKWWQKVLFWSSYRQMAFLLFQTSQNIEMQLPKANLGFAICSCTEQFVRFRAGAA